MLTIKGLGPKKIRIIWRDLGIESVGELLYACNENRLIEAKGFGLKTQEEIRKSIELSNANQGLFLYAKVEDAASSLLGSFTSAFPDGQHALTGEFRRKCEIISSIDILTTCTLSDVLSFLAKRTEYTIEEQQDSQLTCVDERGIH